MRIESLLIERYGIHADRRLEFEPGLQVIYGPNEAGKTTLLQLIRDLFFGFKDRHPYKFDDKPLKATAHCLTQAGQELWFSRQKGRPDLVEGRFASGDVIDAEGLERLIGHLSPSTYQGLFAFSLKDLQEGGAVLKEAGLQRTLWGAGLGGLAQLQSLQQRVRTEQEDLLKVHGAAKKPYINDLLIQLQKAKEAHRQAVLRPHEYARQVEGLKGQEQQIIEIRERLDGLLQEQSRLKRYQRVLPIHRECELLRASVGELPRPGSYPADAVERFRRLQERGDEIRQELEAIDATEPQSADSASAELEDERLLNAAAEIRSLRARYDMLAGKSAQQSALVTRRDQARTELQTLLRELPDGWSLDRLSALRRAMQDVDELERIRTDSSERRQRLASRNDRLADLTARIESLEKTLADHPEDPRLSALESLLEVREQDWKLRSRLSQVKCRIDELCHSIEAHRRSLAAGTEWLTAPPADAESLLHIQTPLPSAVAEYERQSSRLNEEQARTADALSQLQSRLNEAQCKLEDLRGQRGILDPQRLKSLREQRNATWAAIRQQWSREAPAGPVSPSNQLLSEFEQSLDACDSLADEFLRRAEEIAEQNRLESEVERLRQSMKRVHDEQAACEQRRGDFETSWQRLWEASGIKPHQPTVMQSWLELLHESRGLHAELIGHEREKRELESELESARLQLTRAFPDAASIDDAWRRAQLLRDELRKRDSQREQARKEHDDLSGRRLVVEQQRYELALELAQLEQQAIAVLEPYDFPRHWSVETARRTLHDLMEASRRQHDVAELDAFLDQQDRDWQTFRGQFAAVLQRVAPELSSLAIDAALAEIEQQLEAAEARSARRLQLAQHATHVERDRLELLRKQQDVADQVEQLAEQCGADASELVAFIERAAESIELGQRLANREAQLAAALQAGETEHGLADVDVDSLASRLHGVERDLLRCEQEFNQAQEQLGVLRRDLAQLELDEKPLATAAELSGLHAKLAHAVDQWAPLVLADTLMTRARERFQKEHQPRLIADVERIFRQMTGGTYQEIVCSLDQNDEHPIQVRHRDGGLRNPNQLSAGTSEQLYLAIRLAYVADYNRLAEPMPMVMDDVLVNFDESRAKETLQLLIELALSSQILFLTCHRRTIDLLNDLKPQSSIIEMNGSLDVPHTAVGQIAPLEHDGDSRKSGRRTTRRGERAEQPALFPPTH